MNELYLPRIPSLPAFLIQCATLFRGASAAARMAIVASFMTVMVGCVKPPEPSQAGNRDHLLGWFKLPERNEKKEVISGRDTLIPVFKRDGTYYSVCRGAEVPLKECSEGLEWAPAPSSMVGTKIGWDPVSKTYYLAVMDQQASNYSDGRYGRGEKETMTRIEKPSGLLDAKARRPRNRDDFIGWYQPLWFPVVRIGIRKDGNQYFSQEQEFSGPEPGSWKTRVKPQELTPLSDQPGFTFERDSGVRLVYNEALQRFELMSERGAMTPFVVRMPLARVSAPSSPEGGTAPPRPVKIGIPSWH